MSAIDSVTKFIRIVVVENDSVFRESIVLHLRCKGYLVTGVHNSTALYRDLIERPVDIVVLNVDLPGDNGLIIASELRAMQRTRQLGIIMLTSHDDLQARLEGLESGADIFLSKTVHLEEMNATIDSLYRRLTLNTAHSSKIPWRFLKTEWKLIAPSGIEIVLTHLEMLLIDILANDHGLPVSRKEIISTALRQDPLAYDERRLEAVVSRLRRKIAKVFATSQPLKVAHSVGYIFADAICRG
ncbi:response regulator transcription factor [Glaciimonas sp. GG7]